MMRDARCLSALCALVTLVFAAPSSVQAQAQPYFGPDRQAIYAKLRREINAITIFDNHGHPGLPDDGEVDATQIPADSSLPFRLRMDNAEFVAASRALFGYTYNDFAPQHAASLVLEKKNLREKLGAAYFSRVLDEVGIETAIANRVSMPPYLQGARFRWVFFVDPFLFPLNNEGFAAKNPDLKLNVPLEEKLLQRYFSEASLKQVPSSFSDYLAFISRILQQKKQAGGVGIKFEIAYFRSLFFADPARDKAEKIYSQYARGGSAPDGDYRDLQDFIFRYILQEAGRLQLPVQIHTAVGGGDYFNLSDGNIMKLESVLRDPRFGNVTFVLLHGGFPREREAIWLAARKNVYLDSSLMELFLYPEEFKRSLQQWLETFPEKIVFGSDTFPISDVTGAEEFYWLAAESSRNALAAALAEMVSENEITELQAAAFAHKYLHDTAVQLYK